MTIWTNVAQYITEALAIVLIFRLLWLPDKKDKVYIFFAAFLSMQLVESVAFFACNRWRGIDYRVVWLVGSVLSSVLSLGLVYSVANAVLAEVPGVLRISKTLLKIIFPLALLIALSTSRSEYVVTGSNSLHDPLDRVVSLVVVADKAISMVAVVVLVVILAFILWFPVRMAKNLAIFSFGFAVYFAAKSGLDLLSFYAFSDVNTRISISVALSSVVVLCFAYWLVFMDSKGQIVQVRLGHAWSLAEQGRLLEQMESLNGVLLRTSQRLQ